MKPPSCQRFSELLKKPCLHLVGLAMAVVTAVQLVWDLATVKMIDVILMKPFSDTPCGGIFYVSSLIY